MSQKNTVPGVPALPGGTGITLTVGKDGIAPGAGTLLVGAMPKFERPTNKSGSDAGLSKATQFGSWLVRAGTARESCTV
jgi:hypothetical protein